MTEVVALAVLVISVIWGAAIAPGRRLSWAMYSGSSKGFLWLRGEPEPRWAGMDDLRLVPEAHYLRETDLQALVNEGLAPLDGLIVGTRGSMTVSLEAGESLVTETLDGDEVLARLAVALRRYECSQR